MQTKNRNPLPLLLFPPVKECSGMVLSSTIKYTVEPPWATASCKRPRTISNNLLTLTEPETITSVSIENLYRNPADLPSLSLFSLEGCQVEECL